MDIKYVRMENPLGAKVKARLKELRQTQTWLAKQVGLSPAQITQIIKGQRGTSVDVLIDIGRVLGIDRGEVISLYRKEKTENKLDIREKIQRDLDRIERMNESRLYQVAEYIELIADSIKGK